MLSPTRQTNEVGAYVFDFVLPGTYELKVEVDGFRSFVQQNILVQTRADITVNAALEVGAVAETITVEEAPVAVSFNSTTMETTLDTKMANELPIIHRNPFLLRSSIPP
ncbi:MAG: carboxypeptidase-like regulatory domain-containing protein [Bryobacterales bacterium]